MDRCHWFSDLPVATHQRLRALRGAWQQGFESGLRRSTSKGWPDWANLRRPEPILIRNRRPALTVVSQGQPPPPKVVRPRAGCHVPKLAPSFLLIVRGGRPGLESFKKGGAGGALIPGAKTHRLRASRRVWVAATSGGQSEHQSAQISTGGGKGIGSPSPAAQDPSVGVGARATAGSRSGSPPLYLSSTVPGDALAGHA
jgi:hypothetical protein